MLAPAGPTQYRRFHFHHKSRMQATRLLRLLDLSFLAKGTNIVLIGNPGVGQTFLAKLIHTPRRKSHAKTEIPEEILNFLN